MLKRSFDVLVSSILLVGFSPLFLIVAALIAVESGTPIFHHALRVGRGGSLFTLYKFRSMVVNASSTGPGLTRQGDRRVTRVGRFLRKFKIDEMPQLINVLKGEMSMVGPRPEDPRYVLRYTTEQRRVLGVRPGISSPASIKYCNEEELLAPRESDLERLYLTTILPDKLRLDLEYLERQSVLVDLVVLIQTAAAIVWPSGSGVKPSVRPAILLGLARRCLPWGFIDASIVAGGLSLAWVTRSITADLDLRPLVPFGLLAVAVFCGVNRGFRLYQRIWCYASAGEVVVIAASVATSTALLLLNDLLWPGGYPVPLSVVLMTGLFVFLGFVAVRYRRRLWTGFLWRWRAVWGQFPVSRPRVLIVGAGEAGQLLAWRFLNEREGEEYQLVGFADDDPGKWGKWIHGIPILGDRDAIPKLVAQHHVELIVIVAYDISGGDFRAILDTCEQTPAVIKVLPNIFHLMKSTRGLPPIRDIDAEDLLGRKPVEIDLEACINLVAGKRVLVTGAAGSIGSELCRQIIAFDPRQLLMVDNNESGLHDLVVGLEAGAVASMTRRCPVPIIADVSNRARMETIFANHSPEIVFHAAAYKHVPLMEHHPGEAVRVNVLGTRVVAELASRYDAERFVLVSTDKAVNPSSVMGATKLVSEMLTAGGAGAGNGGNARGGGTAEEAGDGGTPTAIGERTLLTAVRFGNVLASRGSVVPTFERQIEQGGPVTVTDPGMTRYFMSIPEAASLIIQAAALTTGGDLFMLDMGEWISIDALARRLIRLRGLRPQIDIPIVYTGVRPGEKMHEELLGEEEVRYPTAHPHIFRISGNHVGNPTWLQQRIDALIAAAERQREDEVVRLLTEIVDLERPEALPRASGNNGGR